MNLKYIQEKLNEIFNEDSRQLVFWYDDNAEFLEVIDDLKLSNAKIYKLEEYNCLYTKYFLEIEDTKNNYLIYAPFSRPNDEDNYLADMSYYATPFNADKISIIAQELNIPNACKDILNKYYKFWNADSRVNSFKELNIEKYSEENIKIAILCVLANVRIINFDELLRKVLTDDNLDKNKYLIEFEKMDILNVFWDLNKEKYGYYEEYPTIEKFLISLLITYTSTRFQGNIPISWKKLLSNKQNDIVVFIDTLMNNINYKDKYDKISSVIAKKINLESHLSRISVESYFDCDTFEIFDEKIINHLTDLLISNQEEIPSVQELIANRQKTHFYDKNAPQYNVINWSNRLIKDINEFSNEEYPTTVGQIIDIYCNKWSYIDRSYREFYYAYDKIENKNKFQDLRQLIENMYSNTYLSKLAMLWSDKLEEYDSINDLPANKQFNFFNDNVRRSIKKHKTVVIISDALRYECANELKDKINSDPTRIAKIDPMVSSLPSVTDLGMASLLPNKDIKFNDNYKVLVDNRYCSNTIERQKVLENYISEVLAIEYGELMSLNMAELRNRIKNKVLIYVFHNQIDARGDNPATENEIFTASKEAIEEIIRLITKLTNEASFKNYWITADHGFLYKRDKISEGFKVDLSHGKIDVKNKRYLLSKENLKINGTSTYLLDYLGSNNIIVTVPRGVDIFKIQGAGQNYVHGGASLQEIIVPLINVKSESTSKNQEYVELNLVSLNKKITNLSTFLIFAQKENISNKVLPLETNLYFEDENEDKISNEVIIHANKNVDSAKDREFKEKFTFRNRKYSKNGKYYLIMKNMENDVEIKRYEFIIDIAISDEFVFD